MMPSGSPPWELASEPAGAPTGARVAFGAPGIEPRWTRAAKDAVGTARDTGSPVWFTISSGILNEIYYPTIDRPQVRDLQLLVTDGESFFHDERRHLDASIEPIDGALGFVVTTRDREGRYQLEKEIVTDPDTATLLIRVELHADEPVRSRLRLFVLCAPHLEIGGYGNNGQVIEANSRKVLTAWKRRTWLALGADQPFLKASVGYVASSDGWQDLSTNLTMDWEFDVALDGNIALTGELDFSATDEAILALAFADHRHGALTGMLQALGHDFGDFRQKFVGQWRRGAPELVPLGSVAGDGGALYRTSAQLLLAHEDKRYPGALIASLSIPWGDEKGDGELGGYHLVWTRDMVNSATGLLATGNTEAPLRSLIYLAATQHADGGFPQNFWISGEPYWNGVQLDEVAFPILLAWRLWDCGGLEQFDPYPMVRRAAGYLIQRGPVTPQERWEEASGYSPSTLAATIAALVAAAQMARSRGDHDLSRFLEEQADYLEARIEHLTVTTSGTLHPHISRHYIRIHPVDPLDPYPNEDPNQGVLILANRPPGGQFAWPAPEVVDAGFLELVRYGIRPPGDSLIEDSLQVVDHCLRFDSPSGTAWYRYNHDGYGQRDDGTGYHIWGRGRPWPLLTGERGHYEFATGRDPMPYIDWMEGFATGAGLLPEQVWDRPDLLQYGLSFGRPTGAAMPLMWAHAEYIKLLRSVYDGEVFDRVPPVADRYLRGRGRMANMEVWKPTRRVPTAPRGGVLRVLAAVPFGLSVTFDGWATAHEEQATDTTIGVWFVDLTVARDLNAPVRFVFHGIDLDWAKQEHQVHPVG